MPELEIFEILMCHCEAKGNISFVWMEAQKAGEIVNNFVSCIGQKTPIFNSRAEFLGLFGIRSRKDNNHED